MVSASVLKGRGVKVGLKHLTLLPLPASLPSLLCPLVGASSTLASFAERCLLCLCFWLVPSTRQALSPDAHRLHVLLCPNSTLPETRHMVSLVRLAGSSEAEHVLRV